jgi:hypothetical protein
MIAKYFAWQIPFKVLWVCKARLPYAHKDYKDGVHQIACGDNKKEAVESLKKSYYHKYGVEEFEEVESRELV